MRTAGIIAEYNPFHNGHRYHIEQCRLAGATHVAVVMSGNFMQRGEPAFLEKRERARAALLGGADLIIELPLPYAMAAAERFAFGAVSLLDALGFVDMLCFGSENGSAAAIQAAAGCVDNPDFKRELSRLLNTGITFARARHEAARLLLGDGGAEPLLSPNDSLAVEYIRRVNALGSSMQPFAVKRYGAEHDSRGHAFGISSASHIRALAGSHGAQSVRSLMPQESFLILENELQRGEAPVSAPALEKAVLARLRLMKREELERLPDLSEGIQNRLYDCVRGALSLEGLHMCIKTKRYTLARVRRLVLNAFLSVDAQLCRRSPPYVRVLGFNEKGRELLARMKETCPLPVSGSLARLRDTSAHASDMAALEAAATDIYTLLTPSPKPCGYDYTRPALHI